ncbi:putative chromatin regulator PHD family [Dioscorea sansibarensis]
MKGRSHPLPTADPPDDWGDGSWTVDCSCGVTYDDGEEMVSCDECGVWVHTRCSRFSKGDSSFACHKCTAPSSSSAHAIGGDAEETEVARLLAELPTKAGYSCFPNPSPPRRPFRLWAETPLEDRVHVQGVPGGDPALFRGLSSVFTSELWKCTGYVPKKFNFQYKEFPCWDEKEVDEEEEDENPANRGAGVLFSLSKEILPRGPSARNFDWRSSSEGVRKREGVRALGGGSRSQSSGKKERNNRFRVLGSHSGKRKKEERGEGKDRSSKKKARSVAHKAMEANNKRGSVGRVNKSDMFEDGSLQVAESNSGEKMEDRKNGLSEPNSGDHLVEEDKVSKKPGNTIVVNAQRGSFSDQGLKQNSSEAPVKVGRAEQLDIVKSENATDDDAFIAAGGQGNEPVKVFVKEEDVSNVVHGLKQPKDGDQQEGVVKVSENSNHVDTIPRDNHPGIVDSTKPPDANGTNLLSSKMYEIEVKSEFGGEHITENAEFQSHTTTNGILADAHQVLRKPHVSMCCSTENPQQHETIICLQPDEHRSHGEVVDESAGLVVAPEGSTEGKLDSVNALESLKSGDPDISHSTCNAYELDNGGRIASPIQVTSRGDSAGPTSSLEGKHDSIAYDSSKSAGPYTGQLASGGHRGLGKIPSSAQVSSRSVLGKSESAGIAVSLTTMKAAVPSSKPHRVKVNTSSVGKKEDVTIGVSAEESTRVISKHPTKETSRGSTCSESILSQPSKISYGSVSKHDLSDSKEKHAGSSSRASDRANMGILSEVNTQGASLVQIKVKSSTCQKNEKNNQPFSQPSSKIFNNSIGMRLPTSVNTLNAGLSDEELALLLHQQLNSSPRVPRVPRVRQATGMQLTSPTGTSMLSKRSSFSGGKDHVVVPRRKNKEDPSRDGSRNSRELSGETKRLGRYPPSPDKKHQDSPLMTVGSFKNDARSRSPDSATSGRKNTPIASTAGSNSTHSSSLDANGQNVLATRSLTRDISDDDGVSARTLPGLVDEIMKKGRCTTYEELCDAVHPHWHSLRKPNGERYAYSSHSQAVLDCLRNRNEWSHLIDRGPKTNSSKKRRKIDSDTSYIESDSEDAKNKDTKEEDDKNGDSHREDFPKGKRKARKRRHLGPHSRSSKDRKRHKQDLTENDLAAHSHSSNDDGDSDEDESQEARPHAVGTEVSASSSDETD